HTSRHQTHTACTRILVHRRSTAIRCSIFPKEPPWRMGFFLPKLESWPAAAVNRRLRSLAKPKPNRPNHFRSEIPTRTGQQPTVGSKDRRRRNPSAAISSVRPAAASNGPDPAFTLRPSASSRPIKTESRSLMESPSNPNPRTHQPANRPRQWTAKQHQQRTAISI
ncbi:hypothetical protein ACLOJK_018335, partial [Asimina triloba]